MRRGTLFDPTPYETLAYIALLLLCFKRAGHRYPFPWSHTTTDAATDGTAGADIDQFAVSPADFGTDLRADVDSFSQGDVDADISADQ